MLGFGGGGGGILGNNSIRFIVDINYSYIAYEIFSLGIYNFHYNNIISANKKYTVFDIGANRGYSALFFAEKEWCKDVYGFEIIPQTYNYAMENINLNPNYKTKIYFFDYGLGAEDKDVTVQHLSHRDGISSMVPEFLQNYAPNEKTITMCVQIRKASETLRQIILENAVDDIIIKVDAEGAEYQIFDDLIQSFPEIFSKVKMIVGETHLGFDTFYNKIKPFGFEAVWTEPHNNGTCPFEIIRK
jgi:FkbM family methyltransferase